MNTYFSLGVDSKKIEANTIKNIEKLYYGFLNNNLVQVLDNKLYYDGFEFHKIKSYYKPKINKNNYYFIDAEIIAKTNVIDLEPRDFVMLKLN